MKAGTMPSIKWLIKEGLHMRNVYIINTLTITFLLNFVYFDFIYLINKVWKIFAACHSLFLISYKSVTFYR